MITVKLTSKQANELILILASAMPKTEEQGDILAFVHNQIRAQLK